MSEVSEDEIDLPLVIELMRRSCEAGNATACENVQVLEGMQREAGG